MGGRCGPWGQSLYKVRKDQITEDRMGVHGVSFEQRKQEEHRTATMMEA